VDAERSVCEPESSGRGSREVPPATIGAGAGRVGEARSTSSTPVEHPPRSHSGAGKRGYLATSGPFDFHVSARSAKGPCWQRQN